MHAIWTTLWTLGLLVATGLARAEPSVPSISRGLGEVTRFRLPNGLDVVMQEMHRQPRIAVIVTYDVGTRDDPVDRHGLAHLVEHMTYRGSRHLAPNQGTILLQGLGASDLDGATRDDITRYSATVPAAALATMLWVESERMAFTLERFAEDSLALEKRIVEGERRLRKPTEFDFWQQSTAAAFGDEHPYARGLSAPALAAISLDDAREFYRAHYRPGNAHLILIGDFRASEARELVTKYFGPIVSPEPARPRDALAERTVVHARERNVGYSGPGLDMLGVKWFVPSRPESTALAVQLILHGLRAHVRAALVGIKPASLKVFVAPAAGGSVATVEVAVSSDSTFQHVEHAVKAALAGFWHTDLVSLLEEAKRAETMRLLARAEDPMKLARAHVDSLTLTGAPISLARSLAELQALSVASVQELRPYFAEERWAITRLRRYGAAPAPGAPTSPAP